VTLEAALARAKGNVSLVAEQNGWHRTQVYRWIRRAGIDPDQYR
jgi:transcriptional regulator of acetoin/glycerol metabolism